MKRSGVPGGPSVCLSHRSTVAAACSGFAAERPAGRRYRSIAGAGAQQQMRAVSRFQRRDEAGYGIVLLLRFVSAARLLDGDRLPVRHDHVDRPTQLPVAVLRVRRRRRLLARQLRRE